MVKSDATSDTELIERARGGDHHAFKTLVERYEGLIAGTIIGMLGRGPEAEDVGQETFIRFYRALNGFRGESAVGTYLTRIAINQSLKAIRKRRGFLGRLSPLDTEEAESLDSNTDVGRMYEEGERDRLVHQALQTLPPDQRAVVVLRMLQEYSTRETSRMLRIPEGTVMSRLSRALQKLEAVLGPVLRDGITAVE